MSSTPFNEIANSTAEVMAAHIPPTQGPAILAIIDPYRQVAHLAKAYAQHNRELIKQALPNVCLRIVETWAEDGHVRYVPAEA